MKGSGKNIIILIVSVVIIAAFPVIIYSVFASGNDTKNVENTLGITMGEVLDYLLSYISLIGSIFLGIVVYFQSQKINDLEETNYNCFLGIVDVDYNCDFGDCLWSDGTQNDFKIFHMFTSNRKVLISSIHLGDDPIKTPALLPLVFVTKNQPLIVSLKIEKVNVKLSHCDVVVSKENFVNKGSPVYALMEDGTHFVLGFGLMTSKSLSFDEIALEFDIVVEDQNFREHKINSSIRLNKSGSESDYYLTESRSHLK